MSSEQEEIVNEEDSLLETNYTEEKEESFHNNYSFEKLKEQDTQDLIVWYDSRFTNKKTQNRIHQILGFREIYLE